MKVSILLPTFNGGNYISKSIHSVLSQSFTNYELIVIDDGSNDDTPQVVKQFAAYEHRIRYIRQNCNRGFQQTLNYGLQLSKGEYIARIDDDDIWIDKDKLAQQVLYLDSHPGHVLIGTGHIFVDETGKELYRYQPPETDRQIRNNILWANGFLHSAVMYRRDLAIKVGGYNYPKIHGDDYDLWLKLGIIGKFANLRIFAVAYNTRVGNISSINKLSQLKNSIDIIKNYKYCYNHYYYALFRRCIELILYGMMGVSPYSYNKIILINKIRKRFSKS
jgi:glycosyltransferase involved in cell wall biosynthesis